MIDSTPFRKQVANSLLRAAKQTAQCAREDRDDNDPDGHAHWTRMTGSPARASAQADGDSRIASPKHSLRSAGQGFHPSRLSREKVEKLY